MGRKRRGRRIAGLPVFLSTPSTTVRSTDKLNSADNFEILSLHYNVFNVRFVRLSFAYFRQFMSNFIGMSFASNSARSTPLQCASFASFRRSPFQLDGISTRLSFTNPRNPFVNCLRIFSPCSSLSAQITTLSNGDLRIISSFLSVITEPPNAIAGFPTLNHVKASISASHTIASVMLCS